jgi:hypothetical protein
MNTADGMIIRISFNGRGAQTAGENEQMAISQLASEIVTSAERSIEPIELDAIQNALSRYFNALAAGDYSTAAALYGGSYDILISNNPDISPSDKAALFQRACTQNGFVCDVTVKNWVNAVRISQDEFRLTVELQNPDGTLFVLGPLGAANGLNGTVEWRSRWLRCARHDHSVTSSPLSPVTLGSPSVTPNAARGLQVQFNH